MFINKNEVHYHIKEDKKKKSNKNEISREKCNNKLKDCFYHGNLIGHFFEDDIGMEKNIEYNYNSEAFIEIYQINFNNNKNK